MISKEYLEWAIKFRIESVLNHTLSIIEAKKMIMKNIDEYLKQENGD